MKISIIIPALNEEGHIEKAVLSANGADEIIVVDGGSVDGTVSAAKKSGAKVIMTEKGRGIQQDAGAKESSGDAFLFLHADTILPDKWRDMVEKALNNKDIAGGAFLLGIDSLRPSLYFIKWTANIRSRCFGLIYGDQAIFVRRDVFYKIGGFRRLSIMEDVDFIRRLKQQGRIKLLSKEVLTSSRRWENKGLLLNTFKNWLCLFMYYIGVSPEKLYRIYYKGRAQGLWTLNR